jgi:hypothetical protein
MTETIKQLQQKRQEYLEMLQVCNNVITADAELGIEMSPALRTMTLNALHDLQKINTLIDKESK